MLELTQHIAATLQLLRKQRSWSLDKAAQATSVSKAMLGQIERGESKISLSVLSKIINTLKIDANELFWSTDTHTSESQQLDNQIALYAKQLSIDKKHIVLNLMDDLKNLN